MVSFTALYFISGGDGEKPSPFALSDETIERVYEERTIETEQVMVKKYRSIVDELEEKRRIESHDLFMEEVAEKYKKEKEEEETKRKKQKEIAVKKEEEKKRQDGSNWQTFEITAYTNYVESTGKNKGDPLFGVTASGLKTQEGVTIACPPELEFDTKIYIEILNHTYVCQDRGSAIHGEKIDVYMHSIQDARNFGRQSSRVKIIRSGD